MSLIKKDPSLRVAANEPHFVSLGGGRLSTAVTIHNIPIGDMTIGSSTSCSISLNGTGVRPIHCTIYRSEQNEVTIVPEREARILIDGTSIVHETNLTQGAMITIGNSNYLRFNNPAEAQMMRSAMGSNERISMPQIDFTQLGAKLGQQSSHGDDDLESFYENTINPGHSPELWMKGKEMEGGFPAHYNPIDINGLQCPKVFTADLVTVNMPAKDVLGQKYANFAKNLAENHRGGDKPVTSPLRNNQCQPRTGGAANGGTYVNIPSSSGYIQNTQAMGSTEYLAKVNNTTPLRSLNTSAASSSSHHHNVSAYDRYPKPGTYGGSALQIFPMNGLNTEINNGSPAKTANASTASDRLEDMLKICTEYADRQNQSTNSITSSPIVQNRIKTNGSLPRDKKSPFYHELSGSQCNGLGGSSGNLTAKSMNPSSTSSSSGYENVRLVGNNRVEINGQVVGPPANGSGLASPKSGYENVVIGKYVPQSPRTKIRTTCMSPKKEHSFGGVFGAQPQTAKPAISQKPSLAKQNEYEQLIRTFEEKLKLEMQAIEASSRNQVNGQANGHGGSQYGSPAKRSNKNINNLTLNLQQQSNSLQNSPKLSKKPAPAPRSLKTLNKAETGSSGSLSSLRARLEETFNAHTNGRMADDVEELRRSRKDLMSRIHALKTEISDLQKQEDETLRDMNLEKALVSAELNSVGDSVGEFEAQLLVLQQKIHRLEAQRNSTRVMEENQQAKLKQSIEMKQDQIKKLTALLKQKANNECLKEELHNVAESLENDRKTFEDLEFQYLEEESEWHAYREELHADEKAIKQQIDEKRLEMQHLERQELCNSSNTDAKTLKHKLLTLLNDLKVQQEHLKSVDSSLCELTGQLHISSSDDEDEQGGKLSASTATTTSPPPQGNNLGSSSGMMSQSLFGSAEMLCPKRHNAGDDIMSKSVNENMFYNNKIELPLAQASSTPKRPQMKLVDIDDKDLLGDEKAQRRDEATAGGQDSPGTAAERVKFNLSLGSDDFEVNPLERRVPSQDDIDRICKVTLDAPISTKGASTKIFDSIKEIERNRQLLLAQQGHHVIEHERQKMNDLKKKCHDEARAQYLQMLSNSIDGSTGKASPPLGSNSQLKQQLRALEMEDETKALTPPPTAARPPPSAEQRPSHNNNNAVKPEQVKQQEQESTAAVEQQPSPTTSTTSPTNEQRHSQPEFDSQQHRLLLQQHQHHLLLQQQQHQQQQQQRSSPRPLSDANSELSCDLLSADSANSPHRRSSTGGNGSGGMCKSSIELSLTPCSNNSAGQRYSGDPSSSANLSGDEQNGQPNKRSSLNSNDTHSAGSSGGTAAYSERKRMLPKHQRPLTRYLPIFSPDLNLRHHIESAGHQIALCPHVFVDAYSCRGYLHKLGATFHGWARRWFVLDRERSALIYYADKSERKPRGGAYFSTIDEVYLDHLNASKSGRPHCTLIVKTKKRSYHLQAASDAAARIWIDAIITGAQGNLDY